MRKAAVPHPLMIATHCSYSFGPVPSRRLGKSLGINNIPAKVCTYSCVYCQVGKTTQLEADRRRFYPPENIFQNVKNRLAMTKNAGEQVDYLTFVPDGEPTLDIHLGKEIELLKKLDVPIGVITNSSLLWRRDVRSALAKADWVSLKIDTVSERAWRKLNRPHNALDPAGIREGIIAFAAGFSGNLVTETMLVGGLNDGESHIRETADFVFRVKPKIAFLAVPTRPPALEWVRPPDESRLNGAFQIFAEKLPHVEYLIGYEGDAFAFTGDVEKDILGITAVHPMKQKAMETLLSRAGATWSLVDRMMDRGELIEVDYQGNRFYLRRFQ